MFPFEMKLENESGAIVNINDEQRYVVLRCDGLNPPPASLFTAKSPNKKGSKYNGSTLDERTLIITIKILGDIEKNRNSLYEWIDTEQYAKIYFKNGEKNVYCEGHVTDCDVDFFANSETAAVSITCEDPYFKELQMIAAELSLILKQFTFPFAIDSKGIPFSTIRETTETGVYNAGAETGAIIKIKAKGTVENVRIFSASDTSKRFILNMELLENYVVTIDTERSPRTVTLTMPDGTTQNILKYVGANPTWFRLKKGLNKFGYTVASGSSLSDVEITFNFSQKYLGV